METNLSEKIISAHALASEMEVYLLSKPNKPELPISSMPYLNEKLWGFGRGRIVIVAARTAMGKSAFLTQAAWDLAKHGCKTIYLSLEMPKEELHTRCFCRNYNVNNRELERGNFTIHKEKYKKFINEHKGLSLKYSDCLGYNWKEIDNTIQAMKSNKPDVFIIDHLHHIKTSGINDKAVIDDYLTNIHVISKLHNITFLIGAQINRLASNDNKHRPELHYLKGTGKLEEVADLALLLHWPYYYDQKKSMSDYEIIIAKNRFGGTGLHACQFFAPYSRFEENQEQKKHYGSATEQYQNLTEMYRLDTFAEKTQSAMQKLKDLKFLEQRYQEILVVCKMFNAQRLTVVKETFQENTNRERKERLEKILKLK